MARFRQNNSGGVLMQFVYLNDYSFKEHATIAIFIETLVYLCYVFIYVVYVYFNTGMKRETWASDLLICKKCSPNIVPVDQLLLCGDTHVHDQLVCYRTYSWYLYLLHVAVTH